MVASVMTNRWANPAGSGVDPAAMSSIPGWRSWNVRVAFQPGIAFPAIALEKMMLGGDFSERHRMISLVESFPARMMLLFAQYVFLKASFRTFSHQLAQISLPDALCVGRYPHAILMKEKRHGEGETRKILLSVRGSGVEESECDGLRAMLSPLLSPSWRSSNG